MTLQADGYRERAAAYSTQAALHEQTAWRISLARIVTFSLAVVLGILAERLHTWWSVGGALLSAAIFIALVLAHQRARAQRAWFRELAELNHQGAARLQRQWDALPVTRAPHALELHAYADDLDLYGRASLTQILGPVGSASGMATLNAWLLERASPEIVQLRQEAVRELAARRDVREQLAVHARRTRGTRAVDVERFVSWAESPGWLRTHAAVRVLAWLLPAATVLLGIAHATAIVSRPLWLVPVLIAFVLYLTLGGGMRAVFDEAFGREPLFAHYPQMFELVARAGFTSPLLRTLADRLVQAGVPAHERMHALSRLMHLADVRSSSIHPLVFLLTLWDVHVLGGLERWQRDAGPAVRDWLDALGAIEALSALATLHDDEPDWCFPQLVRDARALTAERLGHPLLRADARVSNDVSVGPPGTFLLVTGSNMSGKSTLLRAIGVNAILAQAGAPVCAQRLVLPPLDVYTSIRVQDSLARGVSYFMAELHRLKQIVDGGERARNTDASLLFLLDEILHGTNTAERRIAARHVVRHLIDAGAIGAVTTHDLELADEPSLRAAAQLVHFREQVTESTLTFDYQLRPGLATSTNALQLMRLVGL